MESQILFSHCDINIPTIVCRYCYPTKSNPLPNHEEEEGLSVRRFRAIYQTLSEEQNEFNKFYKSKPNAVSEGLREWWYNTPEIFVMCSLQLMTVPKSDDASVLCKTALGQLLL